VGFSDNVQQYLQTADVFLFPSHGEGLGNAFIEALANNLICISYDNTTFPEFQEKISKKYIYRKRNFF